MSNTPHIKARPEDFAKTVLMPGDPHRSRFIAENFLEDARLINDVRGVQGYTGTYKGVPVTVMASGMGMPSMGIYSYELFNFFGVENIIRVGSAGSYKKQVKVRDLVIAQGACTNSSYISQFAANGSFAPICSYSLLEKSVKIAREMNLRFHVGNVFSSDVFYTDDNLPENQKPVNQWGRLGVLAVEMEAAALYMNAAVSGKNALAICTVSDSLVTGEALSAEERQTSFTEMMRLSLELAVSI